MESAVSPATRSSRAFHQPLAPADRSPLWSRSAALPLACAACAGAALVHVVAHDPGGGDGGLTPCPIRMLTGRWCPGCGMTRATHHLFRGDIGQALSYHLFAPALLACLVAVWVVWLRVATGHGVPALVMSIRVRTHVGAGAVLALFTVVRNLAPFGVLRGG